LFLLLQRDVQRSAHAKRYYCDIHHNQSNWHNRMTSEYPAQGRREHEKRVP